MNAICLASINNKFDYDEYVKDHMKEPEVFADILFLKYDALVTQTLTTIAC